MTETGRVECNILLTETVLAQSHQSHNGIRADSTSGLDELVEAVTSHTSESNPASERLYRLGPHVTCSKFQGGLQGGLQCGLQAPGWSHDDESMMMLMGMTMLACCEVPRRDSHRPATCSWWSLGPGRYRKGGCRSDWLATHNID